MDMIDVGGVMRPSTREKAQELAEAQEAPILAAREAVQAAKQRLLEICIQQYPVGTWVEVNIAAHRSPVHEVLSVNEHGWMYLRNIQTGKERSMSAGSYNISPCKHWYTEMNEETSKPQ